MEWGKAKARLFGAAYCAPYSLEAYEEYRCATPPSAKASKA